VEYFFLHYYLCTQPTKKQHQAYRLAKYEINMPKFLVIFFIVMSVSVFAQEQQLRNQELKEYFAEKEQTAKTMAILTGTAMNPLLIPGALGVYKYYTASEEERHKLFWYYQPWFWGICLGLAVIGFIISIPSITLNLPSVLSSFVELCNKKLGLVLSSPMVFDHGVSFAKQLSNAVPPLEVSYVSASMIPTEWISITIIVPAIFFVFIAIWLLNYVFEVLLFICPFGWIDLILKTMRGIFYVLLFATAIFFPSLIYVLVIPVAVIAVLLFGWSVRRTIMGFVLLEDFIYYRKREVSIDKGGVLVFNSNKNLGRLTEEDGRLKFSYKRYFLFAKTVILDRSETFLKKGFLHSTIHNKGKSVYMLSPRYQKKLEEVKAYLGAQRIEDSCLKKGIKGIIEWSKRLKYEANNLRFN